MLDFFPPKLFFGSGVQELLDKPLFKPVKEFISRPSKKIRGEIVRIGFDLSDAKKPTSEKVLKKVEGIIEAIHAGSLIIDDIQDDSQIRRGRPTLHQEYGIPVALNVGNWLYFWPLIQISHLDISNEQKVKIFEACHTALLNAHYGQALDVGTTIDLLSQEIIYDVCIASMEMKSGALMALALQLGAVIGGASSHRIEQLSRFGHGFGIALQMYDDIGNFSGTNNPKRFEDLRLRRPSWVWAVASRYLNPKEFLEFIHQTQDLSKNSPLTNWAESHSLIPQALKEASVFLEQTLQELEGSLKNPPPGPLNALKDIGDTLKKAYL